MPQVIFPTPDFVEKACKEFDKENELVESALNKLFKDYPENADIRQVLLKVVAVNTLYRTNIFAVEAVAGHIAQNVPNLDASLRSGDPAIVEKIARIRVGGDGKERNFFSFASKYCSWQNQNAFPIYDARVDKYLYDLQKEKKFSGAFMRRDDLYKYVNFHQIVSDLRGYFGLSAYSFKQIDKFMYTYSGVEAPA